MNLLQGITGGLVYSLRSNTCLDANNTRPTKQTGKENKN